MAAELAGERPGPWGQLIYTAYDASQESGRSSGGWQVKQAEGLSAAETELLLELVSTEFPLVRPLSRFPSQAELEALPRRLRYRGDRGGIWVQSVHAGADATGRPNNVFNHAVLDREALGRARSPQPLRPVEAWGAPEWLTPFGAEQVQAAELGRVPQRGSVVTRESVVRFLLDESVYRFDLFALLLDATADALNAGPPVVLVCPEPGEGALWLGALSFFTAAPIAQRLSFSTYERGEALLPALAAGRLPVLSVVPAGDDSWKPDRAAGLVVVDTATDVLITQQGEWPQYETVSGVTVTGTTWSRLMRDVLCEEPAQVVAALEGLDAAVRREPWLATAHPGAALAAAVLSADGFELARPLAAVVVRQALPLDVDPAGQLYAAVREHVVSSATDAASGWAALERSGGTGRLGGLELEAYVELALAEPGWLLADRPPPLPEQLDGLVGPELFGRALNRTGELLRTLPADVPAVRRGVLTIRVVDFLSRLAVKGLIGEPAAFRELVADAADLLCGRLGPELAEQAGPLSPPAARRVGGALGRLAAQWPDGLPGQRLPATVTRLIEPGFPADVLAQTSFTTLEQQPAMTEVLVAGVVGRRTDPRLRGRAAALLIRALAGQDASWDRSAQAEQVEQVLARVAYGRDWESADWAELVRLSDRLGAQLVVPPLLGRLTDWVDRPGAVELARAVLEHGELEWHRPPGLTEPVRSFLCALARTGHEWHLQEYGLPAAAVDILRDGGEAWPGVGDALRGAIAPALTIAAFHVALAATMEPGSEVGRKLRSRMNQVPFGDAWTHALATGYPAAQARLLDLLDARNFYLARYLARGWTRARLHRVPPLHGQPTLTVLPTPQLLQVFLRSRLRGLDPEAFVHACASDEYERAVPDADVDRVKAEWRSILGQDEDPGRRRRGLKLPSRGGKAGDNQRRGGTT